MPWYEEEWSRGILLGIKPDPNSGYRAIVWFEYTRALFNEISEGSLIVIRNFSDRPRDRSGAPEGPRDQTYEEYSILQIDQVHPWHYAIQAPGESGYPAFTVATAENARSDWTNWDERNRDDVSRIRCEAIPLRLAFRRSGNQQGLPEVYPDRSKPMPGYEVRLLRPEMTEAIINRDLEPENCIQLGTHVVQSEVNVQISVPELLTLHFGIFGFTGAGKSNLVSTLVRRCLSRPEDRRGRRVFKIVLFDLMDEYTGLLIDQLSQHRYSRLVIAGREAVDEAMLQACEAAARPSGLQEVQTLSQRAARVWAGRIVLPGELRSERRSYIRPLQRLILDGKVRFYETAEQQGRNFDLDLNDSLNDVGAEAFGDRNRTQQAVARLRQDLQPLLDQAQQTQGEERDVILRQMRQRINQDSQRAQTDKGRRALARLMDQIERFEGSRGSLPEGIWVGPDSIVNLLNYRPQQEGQLYTPSLILGSGF
jgi:Helicase HerA, central domain